MQVSKNAQMVLERRYLAKDKDNKPIETVDGLFRRVAGSIAKADALYDKNADVKALEDRFYELLYRLEKFR